MFVSELLGLKFGLQIARPITETREDYSKRKNNAEFNTRSKKNVLVSNSFENLSPSRLQFHISVE